MSRLNGKQIRKAYAFCVKRDGEHCAICGKRPPEIYLEVDHKDGNPNHNPKDGSNWQLLCRRDNRMKNPRGRGKRKAGTQYKSSILDEARPTTWEAQRNLQFEPAFRHWIHQTVKEKLAKNEHITVDDAINSGAEKVGCSIETAKRYLKKLCSDTGQFIILPDTLQDAKVIAFRYEVKIGMPPEELKGESVE